jgi:hypothetical protein
MATLKTVPNDGSVEQFLDAVEHDTRRDDAKAVCALMEDITGEKPTMYGASIVGFGSYDYTYASGREGSWFLTGFSPRKQNLVLYIMPGFSAHDRLLDSLGKHKKGKSCLYLNRLSDVDMDVLTSLISDSVAHMKEKYGA